MFYLLQQQNKQMNLALYNQLSAYLYRAPVRKQRIGLQQGEHIYQKQYNSMNKKHYYLMKGNNVPHYNMHYDHFRPQQ